MIVYAQLTIEAAQIYDIDPDLVDEILSLMVRDFSHYALALMSKFVNTPDQEQMLRKMIIKPVIDPVKSKRLWENHVLPLSGQYKMAGSEIY
jgi:hypothetical protein